MGPIRSKINLGPYWKFRKPQQTVKQIEYGANMYAGIK